MAKLIGFLALTAADLILLWQLSVKEPLLPPSATGSLLILLNLAAGIRIGDPAGKAYVSSVIELNRRLAEQNNDLTQCNSDLLARVGHPSDKSPEVQGQ